MIMKSDFEINMEARQLEFVRWQAWFNAVNAKTARLKVRTVMIKPPAPQIQYKPGKSWWDWWWK
jgi:hypothetical protein